MSEWSSKPPAIGPMTGRRKATLTFCAACQAFHRTHRHPLGAERCEAMEQARTIRREVLFAGPHVKTVPRMAEPAVVKR